MLSPAQQQTTSNPNINKTIKTQQKKKKNIPAQNVDYISFTYFETKNFIKAQLASTIVLFLH